jgi:protein TonB
MFEAFAQKDHVKRARWISASVGAHAMLLLAAWWAMLGLRAATREVEPPRARLTFYVAPPPPPPPPAGARKRTRPPDPKVIKRPEIVQPQPRPAVDSKSAPEPEAPRGGVQGGVSGGIEGGVVGGVIGEFDSRMTPPRLISGPTIQYTDKALENDVEGLMIVRCILTRTGEVRQCEVRQSVRFMDNAVVQTLEQRRYTAVTLEGRPIEVYYTFRIRLNLPN